MVYKMLVAIDWENINMGNKSDWKFLEKHPQKSITIYVFHSDLQKSSFPIFPHIPIVYEPTPKTEVLNGEKNTTDRHMIKTVLKKVLDENYTEVIIVSDDKIFGHLKTLLDKIAIKTTIEYSDTQSFKKQPVIEHILEILEQIPCTFEELQNNYKKKYNHDINVHSTQQVKLSIKDTLIKLSNMNLINVDEQGKYVSSNHSTLQKIQEGIDENLTAITQILYNNHSKGKELDRSSLFNTIKGNTIFKDSFTSKTEKDKLIEKLIQKNIIKPLGDNYILQ